jgi:hypothetical protein
MADFYLNANVADDTGARLERHGHSVIHGRIYQPSGTSDHIHLAAATRLRRVLVTHDRKDYRLPHGAWHDWFAEWGTPPLPLHGGILVIPQDPVLPAIAAAELVHEFVSALRPGETLHNRPLEWKRGSGWQEIPPRRPIGA